MTAPVVASERDLSALAGIISEDRPDVPADEGLPPSLLADLMDQIRCDVIAFGGLDSARQETWALQSLPDGSQVVVADTAPVHWEHYWHCRPCSYPDRTGDLRSIVKIADFYSARQWHSIGTRCGLYRPLGVEHNLMLTLPTTPALLPGPARTMRLFFLRGPGPDFSERDRALLTLLRPHLHQAYLDAERRRHPRPQLTPRQQDLLRLVAAGHTNTQIARRLGLSESTVRTHLENIYRRLQVSSRAAAVTRALPSRALP
jgi:DNA-binding CsgD family transcriptional regulator